MTEKNGETRKLAIINSKGSLDMAYPGLVVGNSARMIGIEVLMFFTFWGMDIITKKKIANLKISPVGNTSMGMPNIVSVVPGVTDMATWMMKREIERIDAPPVDEFLEMLHDAGAKIYACQMSVDMMNLTEEDFVEQVDGVVNAMEFLEMAEGAQIMFV